MKVLVTDPIAAEGIELLKKSVQLDVRLGISREDLLSCIGEYDALIVRSETKVTEEVIQAGRSLKVVGRAGVGVDNIDVDAATRHGVMVVNAPTGNTISAAELAFGLMLALARNIPQAHATLKSGKWNRSAYVGIELRNKTLGIIGVGRVGSELARRAEAMEMRIIGYDPFVSLELARHIGVELVSMDTLIRESDFISVHTPLTQGTQYLIGEKELAMMKPTARLINAARGGIIDESALIKAVSEGKLAGAALDVFAQEPLPPDSPILNVDNIIVTPHLGASTTEAQTNVAIDVAVDIMSVLEGHPARYAVNAPLFTPETAAIISPLIPVAGVLGRVAAQLVDGQLDTVSIKYEGEISNYDVSAIKAGVIGGMLENVIEERVTLVNANIVAANRGLKVIEQKGPIQENYQNLITVELQASDSTTEVAGTTMRGEIHIVRVDDYWLDIVPSSSYLLLCENQDTPGIIGAIGTILGKADINIAFMQVGRNNPRGKALMVLGLDEPIQESERQQIMSIHQISSVKQVKL
ncbi:MAG: phosphoglycerate dehydrogenase [Dehalococcoidia bacterium]|nr:phosphoglycerate dehydrogenase [Dehalococcoidia bacterium]